MGLLMEVSGSSLNFKLTDYEIVGYDFIHKIADSRYAKGSIALQSLKISGDISRIIEKQPKTLKKIRKWSEDEYENNSYYSFVKIKHTYREELVREITFPNAFLKNYLETLNPHTGHGYFHLLLMQRFDKKNDVIVGPFE